MRFATKELSNFRKSVNIYEFLVIALFTQFILLTKVMMPIKAITLILLLLMSMVQEKWVFRINSAGVCLFIYVLFNIFSTILGILNGYPDYAIRTSTVNIIWPSVCILFTGKYITTNQLIKLYKVFVWLTFFVCLADTILIISREFSLEITMQLLRTINISNLYVNTKGAIVFRSDHMYLYAFLAPFMMASLCGGDKIAIYKTGVRRGFIRLVSVYAIVMSVFSGMGGIWLALAIGFLLCLFRYNMITKRSFLVFITCAIVLLGVIFGVSYYNRGEAWFIMEEIRNHMRFSNKTGYNYRNEQARSIIDKWVECPIFGAGIGAQYTFSDIDGGYITESSGESTYLARLYHTGVVGFALFWMVVFKSATMLNKRKEASFLCDPFLLGMICFLVSAAFNPYLSNMSTVWIIYLPLIIGSVHKE